MITNNERSEELKKTPSRVDGDSLRVEHMASSSEVSLRSKCGNLLFSADKIDTLFSRKLN